MPAGCHQREENGRYNQAQHTPTVIVLLVVYFIRTYATLLYSDMCKINSIIRRYGQQGQTKNYVDGEHKIGFGYVAATRNTKDRNYWWQLIASDPAMDRP